MPRNVDGEFELVLGNKQLLSLFFLVVVLFAVFFSLGYMVGKSVSPATTSASQQPAPAPASDRPPASSGSPATTPPAEAPAAPPTETQPARSEPVAASTTPAAPVEPPKQAAARPAAAATDGGAEDSSALVARGLHLQLAAVHVKDDAEAMVETLRKKGYAVVLHSQARDGWYRVLVGPFPDERAARDAKAQLEKDGYKSILKRP